MKLHPYLSTSARIALSLAMGFTLILLPFPLGAEVNDEEIRDKIRVEIRTGKDRIYLGEKIPLFVRVYAREVSLRDIRLPGLSHEGLTIGEFGSPVQKTEIIKGSSWETIEFKTTLCGERAGEYRVGPLRVQASLIAPKGGRNRPPMPGRRVEEYFGGEEAYPLDIASNEITLNILPLPEKGKPSGFQGAVGDFQMSAGLQLREVAAGDPLTVRVTVTGRGNFESVTAPLIGRKTGMKFFPPQVIKEEGPKVYEQIILSERAGATEVPEIRFSFFNPEDEKYRTLSLGPFPILVKEPGSGQSGIRAGGPGLLSIKRDPGKITRSGTFLYRNKTYLFLHLIPLLAAISLWARNRRKERIRTDPRYAGRIKARKAAKQGLRNTERFFLQGKMQGFYDSVFQTLQQVLGNRLLLPEKSTTFEEVKPVLSGKGLTQEEVLLLEEIFSGCDRARYAPATLSRKEASEIFRKFKEVLNPYTLRTPLPLQKKDRGTLFYLIGMTLFVSFLSLPGTASSPILKAGPPQHLSPIDLFDRAARMYENGNYDQAIDQYRRLLTQGYESGPLYYNLGNCYLRKEDLGRALLNYERAKGLVYYDRDLDATYRYGASLVPGGRLGSPAWTLRGIHSWFRWTSIDGLTVLLSALYLIFTTVFILKGFFPSWKRWTAWILPFLGVMFLLCGLGLSQRVSLLGREAILTAPSAEAKIQPLERAPSHFTLVGGEKVEILQSVRDWVKIRLGNRKVGWIKASNLERI